MKQEGRFLQSTQSGCYLLYLEEEKNKKKKKFQSRKLLRATQMLARTTAACTCDWVAIWHLRGCSLCFAWPFLFSIVWRSMSCIQLLGIWGVEAEITQIAAKLEQCACFPNHTTTDKLQLLGLASGVLLLQEQLLSPSTVPGFLTLPCFLSLVPFFGKQIICSWIIEWQI